VPCLGPLLWAANERSDVTAPVVVVRSGKFIRFQISQIYGIGNRRLVLPLDGVARASVEPSHADVTQKPPSGEKAGVFDAASTRREMVKELGIGGKKPTPFFCSRVLESSLIPVPNSVSFDDISCATNAAGFGLIFNHAV
jgi:hypothetical protein